MGLGIGFMIVCYFVMLYGGWVEVVSDGMGCGVEFSVVLFCLC